jgi:hypothetical protein
MVHCQGEISPAAILATMPIPPQNVLARKNDLLVGNTYVNREPNYAWEWHRHGDRSEQLAGVSLDELGLAEKEKNNGFLNVANTHWFIVLIQNQNFAVQPTMNAFRS